MIPLTRVKEILDNKHKTFIKKKRRNILTDDEYKLKEYQNRLLFRITLAGYGNSDSRKKSPVNTDERKLEKPK